MCGYYATLNALQMQRFSGPQSGSHRGGTSPSQTTNLSDCKNVADAYQAPGNAVEANEHEPVPVRLPEM